MPSNIASDGSSGPPPVCSQSLLMRRFLPMFSRWPIRLLLIGTVLFGVGIGLLMAAIPNQGRTQFFGSSGGNVNDISKSFCCSGTLGSLVKNSSGVEYILSNNHVLADTDQAAPGENISQPGLVDNNCRPATTVAHFTVAPHLGTNVDAALAKLVAGTALCRENCRSFMVGYCSQHATEETD